MEASRLKRSSLGLRGGGFFQQAEGSDVRGCPRYLVGSRQFWPHWLKSG